MDEDKAKVEELEAAIATLHEAALMLIHEQELACRVLSVAEILEANL